MSVGARQTYESALRAFRRGCYQFPTCWSAAVICASTDKAVMAMEEAGRIFEAFSLPVENYNRAGMQIKVGRGGEIRFFATDDRLVDRVRGCQFPQFIIMCGLSDETTERLKTRNRHTYVDEKYCRWDDVF